MKTCPAIRDQLLHKLYSIFRYKYHGKYAHSLSYLKCWLYGGWYYNIYYSLVKKCPPPYKFFPSRANSQTTKLMLVCSCRNYDVQHSLLYWEEFPGMCVVWKCPAFCWLQHEVLLLCGECSGDKDPKNVNMEHPKYTVGCIGNKIMHFYDVKCTFILCINTQPLPRKVIS